MGFATRNDHLSIQMLTHFNGVSEPVTGLPVTNRPFTGRVKRTVAASDGPALRTQRFPREDFGLGDTSNRSWKPFGVTEISTESLILAQDERWRRA